MGISVIPRYAAMLYPEDTTKAKGRFKPLLNLLLGEILVPVKGQETFRCSEKRSRTISVYATAFKDIRPHIKVGGIESACIKNATGNLIVKVRGELEAPPVEHKIKDILLPVISKNGNAAVVTRPGIIDRRLYKADSGNILKSAALQVLHRLAAVTANHKDRLIPEYGRYYAGIAFLNLFNLIPE